MDITPQLELLASSHGSDLYLVTGNVPQMKVQGKLTEVGLPKLEPGMTADITRHMLNSVQAQKFEEEWELNIVHAVPGHGRFRINFFREQNEVGLVVRHVPLEVPTLEKLKVPRAFRDLIMLRHGLVLIVGPTGSGKTTSMAAMIDHRNHHDAGHILTIEDPVEFLHAPDKSVISQREVGTDTHSYAHALKNALREAPDVILLGEIRDAAAMEYAINYAQTGHLCLSTLHANNAEQAVERIVNFFPTTKQKQAMHDLSNVLQGIISQRLVKNNAGKQNIATEILLNNSTSKDLIQKGKFTELTVMMEEHQNEGMMSFNQSLLELYNAGRISRDAALRASDAQTDLSLRMQLGKENTKKKENNSNDFRLDTEF